MKSLTLNKVAPCVFVYDNAIKDGERFIELLEKDIKDDWSPLCWDYSRTGGGTGTISEFRSSRLCSLVDITTPCQKSEISALFNESVLRDINKCLEDYSACHGLPSAMLHEGWIALKYEGESQYRTHWDHWRDNARTLSIVAFPYSNADEGGELSFPYFDVTVKPQSGRVVIFPSNFPYTHTAHPVESGVKYSLVTWLR
jgi:hypothetical protein